MTFALVMILMVVPPVAFAHFATKPLVQYISSTTDKGVILNNWVTLFLFGVLIGQIVPVVIAMNLLSK